MLKFVINRKKINYPYRFPAALLLLSWFMVTNSQGQTENCDSLLISAVEYSKNEDSTILTMDLDPDVCSAIMQEFLFYKGMSFLDVEKIEEGVLAFEEALTYPGDLFEEVYYQLWSGYFLLDMLEESDEIILLLKKDFPESEYLATMQKNTRELKSELTIEELPEPAPQTPFSLYFTSGAGYSNEDSLYNSIDYSNTGGVELEHSFLRGTLSEGFSLFYYQHKEDNNIQDFGLNFNLIYSQGNFSAELSLGKETISGYTKTDSIITSDSSGEVQISVPDPESNWNAELDLGIKGLTAEKNTYSIHAKFYQAKLEENKFKERNISVYGSTHFKTKLPLIFNWELGQNKDFYRNPDTVLFFEDTSVASIFQVSASETNLKFLNLSLMLNYSKKSSEFNTGLGLNYQSFGSPETIYSGTRQRVFNNEDQKLFIYGLLEYQFWVTPSLGVLFSLEGGLEAGKTASIQTNVLQEQSPVETRPVYSTGVHVNYYF